MTRLIRLLVAACGLLGLSCQVPSGHVPKLVVLIVVDQFRYDYLTRFRTDYTGGIGRMLENGAVYSNARYAQAPTVTAVGHSVLMTGAMPTTSGVVGNTWYERETARLVTSVCDPAAHNLGTETPRIETRCEDADAASPRRLLVSTLGDELRNQDPNSRVVGVSLKARSAILPTGHRATGAFWFDDRTGRFVSSDYYFPTLPQWVDEFNRQGLATAYAGRPWEGFPAWSFQAEAGSSRPFERLAASPWGNELVARLAEAAVAGEKLGQRGHLDVLTISFSANDYVGHQVGPDAPEVRDMCRRTDTLIGHLVDEITARVGANSTTFVLTSDHGVAPLPEQLAAQHMPGGYVYLDLEDTARTALARQFGPAPYIAAVVDNIIYFDYRVLRERKVELDAACRAVADALRAVPQAHVARVLLASQLAHGGYGDDIDRAFVNGYYAGRSGDVILVLEPYFQLFSKSSKTTHFSPYTYDTHVPLMFYGAGIRPGLYHENVEINDVAPTLAVVMGVGTPSGSSGRTLAKMLGE